MGGRGASVGKRVMSAAVSSLGDKSVNIPGYEVIPTLLTGVVEIDGIPIIHNINDSRMIPLVRADKKNCMYIVANGIGKIGYIFVYRNYTAVKSIDILKNGTYHQHLWKDGKRQRHDPANRGKVDAKYISLAEKCVAYNIKYFPDR